MPRVIQGWEARFIAQSWVLVSLIRQLDVLPRFVCLVNRPIGSDLVLMRKQECLTEGI